MNFHEKIRRDLIADLETESTDKVAQLNNSMRLLAKWRSILIQNTVLQNEGTLILGGPFKGMQFLEQSSEGCHIAKLLGCYEQPLFQHIETAISSKFTTVLNIGCAEGYYAVGMARRMPSSEIFAFDTNEQAQQTCQTLAVANGVSDRIQIGGHFEPEHFDRFQDQQTLVLCDIEGAELELLQPSQTKSLRHKFIIVESHECLRPGLTETLISRFEGTHYVTQVNDSGTREIPYTPQWFNNLSHLDQLLATWEWRSGPTPWLVMEPKSQY
tara:strand:+ start:339 stop:1148 length:810 start_codon:yes stop_codon:yes gene_type:complete